MQFLYSPEVGNDVLTIHSEQHKYLFKVRRHQIGDTLSFRNLKDSCLYVYEVLNITKKDATLQLISNEEKIIESAQKLHIIWSVVDPKTIEKQLPYLNEIGVDKISFYYADYSQKNFKLNFEKFEKILINSSQQCGRSSIIKLDVIKDLSVYTEAYMLNFSQILIDEVKDIQTIFIGCEGGFSKNEVESFNKDRIVGLNSNLILRSETAVTAVAAKILL